MGPPDMRLPIQYALFYPKRLPNAMIPRLDTSISQTLTFDPMEPGRFPCFELAVAAGKKGGTYPTALSAADEVAVQAFLDSKIRFTEIAKVVDQVLTEHDSLPGDKVEDFLEADRWATGRAIELTAR
jgi:1-deoxy-D-xylulose-5-phosphate reductoisomerase